MYQITIIGQPISKPMSKEEAVAWEGLLRITFPGSVILAIPLLCPACGSPLPEAGPCWHNLFPEEEIITPEELLEDLEAGQ